MAKEFNKKFMHPTRRKLVDMVLTGGEYEKNTQISFSGADKQKVKRGVGEKWTDETGKSWEQLEAGKVQTSELGDRVDKKLISKTGYCLHCLKIREAKIEFDGLWKEYEDYKIYSNMISYGNDIVAQFKQAYRDAKQTYEVVQEDGKIETWSMERDVEELKAEILLEIVKFEGEIEQATKLRNEAYEKLKDKNYDLVRPLND
jgi:hypothetical protein